jgi:hypothetical protein
MGVIRWRDGGRSGFEQLDTLMSIVSPPGNRRKGCGDFEAFSISSED